MQRFRKLQIILALTIIFSTIPFGSISQAESVSPFSDVSDYHWAIQHILKMELRGVVKGTGEGKFSPEKKVTQLEAVIMAVRAMGIEKEIKNLTSTQINNIGIELPKGWGSEPFVALAIQKQIIDTDNFHPSEPATRAWVAQLIVRMIGAEDEVENNATTTFNDDNSIPSWAKGYVSLAADKGIIGGSYDASGKLNANPNNSITRAEFTTMVSRLDPFMLDVDGQLPLGTVSAISGQQITLIDLDKQTKIYQLSSKSALFNQKGERTTLGQIRKDSMIRYGLNTQNQLVYIEELDPKLFEEKLQINGEIVQHFSENYLLTIKEENGKLFTYKYSNETSIKNSTNVKLQSSNLNVGDQVSLSIDENNVIKTIRLNSKSSNGFSNGKIFSLDLNNKILTLENDERYVSYTLADNVTVEYEDVRFPTVNNLKKGDQIEVELLNDQIQTIKLISAYQEENIVNAEVITIATNDSVITLRLSDGSLQAYEVNNSTKIIIDGLENTSISDLKIKDKVDGTVNNGIITTIKVSNRSFISDQVGTVKSIDTSNKYLTIETDNNELKTYPIDENVILDIDVSSPDLYDIKIGMKVSLKLEDNVVYTITHNNQLNGELVRLTDDESYITIKTDNNQSVTYRLDEDVDVNIQNVSYPDLSDLDEGQLVKLTLKQDIVTTIDAKMIEKATITDLDNYRNRITLEIDGDDERYTLTSSTSIVIPNVEKPKFEDLNEDDIVEVTFVGDEVTKIEVLPPVFGSIVSYESYRDRLVIDTNNGRELIDTTSKSMIAFDSDGSRISNQDLKAGDYVKAELGSKIVITRIDKIQARLNIINYNYGRIYVIEGTNTYKNYDLAKNVRVLEDGTERQLGDIEKNQNIELFLLDDEVVSIYLK